MNIAEVIAKELSIQPWQVEAVIALMDEGATVPFIARYRKEQHGELDDTKLRTLEERLQQLRNLEQRRNEISESLKKLDKWTEELQAELDNALTLARLEDIYRPYRPKRRTRAMIAKEKGLEPLADAMLLQLPTKKTPEEMAAEYVDAEKGVESVEDALQGAMDIIAERVSDDAAVRDRLKRLYARECQVKTVAAKEEDSVYRMYYDYAEPMRTMPSHRVLAMDRGEKEGWLKVSLQVDGDHAHTGTRQGWVIQTGSPCTDYVQRACDDEGIGIRFYPGNELLFDSTLPEKLSNGEVLTLADSSYCLVEFHPMDDYHYIYDGLRALLYNGFHPILAHCERYACLSKDKKRVDDIVSQDVLLQCNAASVEQKLFQSIPKFVNGLLKRELVSFIATDAHRPEGDRAPNMLQAAKWLQKKYDGRYVRRLLTENARHLIG